MKYEVVGSNMQYLRVTLQEGERIYADSGTLVSKSANVIMTPKLAGGIMSALKRKATGSTGLLTEFAAKNGAGEVSIAGVLPGKVFQVTLGPDDRFTVEKSSFLAADDSVKYGIQVMGLSVAMFGGGGFYLQELVGPGNVFIHVVGDIIEHDIDEGNTILVEPGHIAGFDSTLKYTIRTVGNVRTMMFGGVGLFLATFEGKGRLVIHSVSPYKLAATLYNTAISLKKK